MTGAQMVAAGYRARTHCVGLLIHDLEQGIQGAEDYVIIPQAQRLLTDTRAWGAIPAEMEALGLRVDALVAATEKPAPVVQPVQVVQMSEEIEDPF